VSIVAAPQPPTGPDSIAFAAAKPLAKLYVSLHHGGCGKQKLG
jgi:hypothetical protein